MTSSPSSESTPRIYNQKKHDLAKRDPLKIGLVYWQMKKFNFLNPDVELSDEKKFKPEVITNLRNCDMSKMHDQFLGRIEKIFPEANEVQKTHAMFAAVQIYWMLDGWDK